MSEIKQESKNSASLLAVERRSEAAGVIAVGLAGEIARPLRELRQQLAVMVDRLDQYMATASGPNALPWEQVDQLRQELADAYLNSRRLARISSELYHAVDPGKGVVETADASKLVEIALHLVRHRISEDTEVFVDLGSGTDVRVIVGDFVLAVASLLNLAANSSSGMDGGAISVRVAKEDEHVVLYVSDNGQGCPEQVDTAMAFALTLAESCAGTFEGAAESGRGSVFEMRLPLASKLG